MKKKFSSGHNPKIFILELCWGNQKFKGSGVLYHHMIGKHLDFKYGLVKHGEKVWETLT